MCVSNINTNVNKAVKNNEIIY